MEGSKHQFYFAVAVITLLAAGGFALLEVTDTMTDLTLIESSLFSVVRNGETRSLSEINRGLQEVDLDTLESGFKGIDGDINNL